MNVILIGIVIAAKFLLPFLMLRFPFWASASNFILDTIDGDILMPLGLEFGTYQLIDKIADYVTYILMVVAARKWEIRKLIIGLFAFRTIGQLLYFATGNEVIFFFFPNFLEPLFIVYSFLLMRYKKNAHAKYRKHIIPIWACIILYKMWNEWNTHIANIELSQVFFGF
ncbi:hypothetical protein JXB11_00885 [Candidatus Woesearchaeota archaeon]|nr:hypothetical protein [Candidatus Woesearchaeota archaeon]